MKQSVFFLFQIIFLHIATAQEPLACRNVAMITVEAINEHSSEKLKKYLSDDFSIAGQKGEVAKLILEQLFAQLADSIQTYEEIEIKTSNKELTLKYNISYLKKGSQEEATFIFNENNLLRELSLFSSMEVKTVSGDPEVINNSAEVFEIPFQMAGKLILVDVLLNGKKRKFIVDSGAPSVILNSNYIEKDTTKTTLTSTTKGVGGSISGLGVEKIKSLDFGGLQLIKEEVITVDLAHLEEELDTPFYGLIGFELLKNHDIIFDYKAQKLTFISPLFFEKYQKEHLSKNELIRTPFELSGHIPIIEAEINKQLFKFGIDSGAETNLMDDSTFDAVKKAAEAIEIDEIIGADDNKKEVTKTDIKAMKIGNKIFKKIDTSFSDISHLNEGYKLNLDGLIGYPILSQQQTLISFARKELIFIK